MKKTIKTIIYLIMVSVVLILPFTLRNSIDVSAFIDYVIYIDPGHGGKDNGATYLNIYEDEINLSIASKLYEKCIKQNFIAYLSRTSDYDLASLYATNRKNEDLKNRANNINHSGSDIFISLHVNQYSSSEVHGPMVYYEKSDESSYTLSKCVQKELNILASTDKKVHFSDFYLFRKCNVTGILIECGFISNDEERNRLLDEKYQQSIVDAIYEGVYQFYLSK